MNNFTLTLDERIKWSIGGQDYLLCKPNVRLIAEFSKKNKELGDDAVAQIDLTISLLAKCGLPEDIALQLSADQISLVVESLMAKKK